MWDWDLRTDTLYLSPRFLEFLDLPPSDGQHKPADWLDRVHPDDVDWLYATFEGQMVSVSLPFQIEHRVRRKHGTGWRWLVCRGVAVADETGEPVRLVGAVADITERKLAEERLRQSEERYALASAASNDGLYDWDLKTGTLYYSPRWKSILGFTEHDIGTSPDEWLGRVVDEDRPALLAALERHRAGCGGEPFLVEYRMRDASGGQRWMACRGLAVMDDQGVAARIVGSQADITDRKEAEHQLRLSEERYALAARGANDGLWDWNLLTGEIYLSPRWKAMLGHQETEVGTNPEEWFARVLAADLAGLEGAIELHLAGERDSLQHECRMHHADGSERWVLVRGLAVRGSSGHAVRMAGSMTDITDRKKAEQQILFDALHDAMTGLANRTLLLDRIGQALDRSRRSDGRPFAVLLLDIDRFKGINDTLGTRVGDRILKTIAERLEGNRRRGDTLARLSADEFGVLIADIDDVGDAMEKAEHLGAAVAQPMQIDEHAIVLTCSIGVALSVSGYERPEDVLRDASLAVFRAKSGGRNRIDVFDNALRRQAMALVRTEADLRRALEEGQLQLHYQPIVAMATGHIAGFEALMRWNHPKRGLVPPADFIPLAEDTGLIVGMGRWALREAVRQVAVWQSRFPRRDPLFMSVNVSSRQFLDDDLPELVRDTLAGTPIPPHTLKLEITESLLMKDPERCRIIMEQIRAMDVRLSIDDFGTGYSSLAYLHRFPADTLKIDKTFVQAATTGGNTGAIVQVVTTLASLLGMDAVAEGVETAAEAAFLRGLSCAYGQGFYYARPAPAADAEALLAAEPSPAASLADAVP